MSLPLPICNTCNRRTPTTFPCDVCGSSGPDFHTIRMQEEAYLAKRDAAERAATSPVRHLIAKAFGLPAAGKGAKGALEPSAGELPEVSQLVEVLEKFVEAAASAEVGRTERWSLHDPTTKRPIVELTLRVLPRDDQAAAENGVQKAQPWKGDLGSEVQVAREVNRLRTSEELRMADLGGAVRHDQAREGRLVEAARILELDGTDALRTARELGLSKAEEPAHEQRRERLLADAVEAVRRGC